MKYLYLSLLILTTSYSYSQTFMGVKAGFSVPSMEGIPGDHNSYLSSLNRYGGLAVNIKINEDISFQGELNFSPKGGHLDGVYLMPAALYDQLGLSEKSSYYVQGRHVIGLNFVEMPFMLKYSMGQKLRYGFCFGPSVGFLIKAKDHQKGNSYVYTDARGTQKLMKDALHPYTAYFDLDRTNTEEYHRIEIGFQGGLDLQYPVGRCMIFTEMRTSIGINNIRKHRNDAGKLYTGLLGLAAGCMVQLK